MNTTSQSVKTKIYPSDPRHPEHEAHLAWFRGLSLKERGVLLEAKCQEAAAAERARIAAGLPPTPEEPFPESTLEFLRFHARRYWAEVAARKAGSLPE